MLIQSIQLQKGFIYNKIYIKLPMKFTNIDLVDA